MNGINKWLVAIAALVSVATNTQAQLVNPCNHYAATGWFTGGGAQPGAADSEGNEWTLQVYRFYRNVQTAYRDTTWSVTEIAVLNDDGTYSYETCYSPQIGPPSYDTETPIDINPGRWSRFCGETTTPMWNMETVSTTYVISNNVFRPGLPANASVAPFSINIALDVENLATDCADPAPTPLLETKNINMGYTKNGKSYMVCPEGNYKVVGTQIGK